jgi:hypothetical protein
VAVPDSAIEGNVAFDIVRPCFHLHVHLPL